MRFKLFALAVSVLAISTSVNAAVVTHGSLSSDDSTNIITDSLNNYEWLRFDVLAGQTYADTLAALNTQDGGGWSIAGVTQANMFVDAMALGSPITCASWNDRCWSLSNWNDGDFGNNWTSLYDNAYFLNDAGRAGFIELYEGPQEFNIDDDYWTIAEVDAFVAGGTARQSTWLTYREVSAVPVPAAVWLFGSGLLGLVGVARRKKV